MGRGEVCGGETLLPAVLHSGWESFTHIQVGSVREPFPQPLLTRQVSFPTVPLLQMEEDLFPQRPVLRMGAPSHSPLCRG